MKLSFRHLPAVLGLLISASALFLLSQQFDFVELTSALRQVDLLVLAPVPVLILMSFALRAQRWRLLVDHQPPVRFWQSFSALMIGYLLNNILPARAGDVARALELGRSERMSRTKVFATLVTERTVDLVMTLTLLAAVLLSYPALPEWIKKAGILISLLSIAAMSVLVLAHTTGRRWIPPLVALLAQWLPGAVRRKIDQMVISALEGIAGMFRPSHAVGFLLLTGFIWTIEVVMVYIVAASVGLLLALGNALLVLLVLAMGSMVPSSPGQLGTYEFVGLAALALVALQGPLALAFIVLLHLLTLVGSTMIGVVCLMVRERSPPLLKDIS
jgi:glycosyltransferase 2 family protein